MVGGPNDTVITPWQSAHLGFYDSNEIVQPFEKQPVSVNKLQFRKTTKMTIYGGSCALHQQVDATPY